MDTSGLGTAYFNDLVLGNSIASQELNSVNSLVNRSGSRNGTFEDLLTKSEPAALQEANTSKTAVIDKTSKLYEQCLELEIFMVKTLISSMRNTVQKSGLIEEGFAGKMYEDMLYDEYARSFTKNANFGMADLAYLELSGQRGMQL